MRMCRGFGSAAWPADLRPGCSSSGACLAGSQHRKPQASTPLPSAPSAPRRLVVELEGAALSPADDLDGKLADTLDSMRRWASWLLGTVLLGPICEELQFRAFLLPSLARWMPPGAAVALSSLAFAASHGSAARFPMVWLCGCILGWSYAATGNLLAPLVLHAAANLGACALMYRLRRQRAAHLGA